MAMEKPWGPIDPNSDHQMWSRWTVWVPQLETSRRPEVREVLENARRFFRLLFGTAGRVRVREEYSLRDLTRGAMVIECEIEGPPAHDPAYRQNITRRLRDHFVARGFGQTEAEGCRIETCILAGDLQDGRPRPQMIVMPHIMAS